MPNKMLISVFFDEIHDIIKNNLKKPSKFLPGDLYYKIQNFSIDAKGSFGQQFLVSGFERNGFRSNIDNDKNKDWDIKLENYRVEVKTATLDVNGKFQHESVHKTENCDLLIFLDIAPNKIFVKGILFDEINFDKLLIHGAGYKYDYSLTLHSKEGNELVELGDLGKHVNN
jgi:hypothetical protein